MPTGKAERADFFLWATDRRARRASVTIGTLLLLCGGVFLAGCQAPAQPSGPTEIVLQLRDYDAFVDASLSLLRRYEFPPDRVDRTRGLIISRPATSAQWFEWWRVDAPGGYHLLESSLITVRRTVTVNVEPLDAPEVPAAETQPTSVRTVVADGVTGEGEEAPTPVSGRFRVRVQVDKARFSAPERQITTASGALAMYNEQVPTVEGRRGPGSRDVQWVPQGRDPLLEGFLLEKLTYALPDVAVAE